jgi:hypothetical protein
MSPPGAGDVYCNDILDEPFTVQPEQLVWARQRNNAYGGTTVLNNGGQPVDAGDEDQAGRNRDRNPQQ